MNQDLILFMLDIIMNYRNVKLTLKTVRQRSGGILVGNLAKVHDTTGNSYFPSLQ